MKICMTGASGALGQAVLSCLRDDPVLREAEIVLLARARPAAEPARPTCTDLRTVVADARDANTMAGVVRRERPDLFFHLAWETTHGSYWNDPDNALWADAAIAAAEAMAANGTGRYIFAGTCAEYSWTGDGPCDEDLTPTEPATQYGAAKLRVSRVIDAMAARGELDGMSGRIFFPFSPVEAPQRVTSLVLRHVLQNKPIHLNAADVYRDFAATSAIASAFVTLAKSSALGVLNVATGQPVHLGEFLRRIAAAAGNGDLVTWPGFGTGSQDQGPRSLHASTARMNAYARVAPPSDDDIKAFVTGATARLATRTA